MGVAMSEGMEARVLVGWLNKHGYKHHHIANEGQRAPRTMAQLKAQGFSGGFPDYIVLTQRCGPAFIELKRKGGKTSSAQLEWIAHLTAAGAYACVAEGAEDAIAWIERIETLGLPVRTVARTLAPSKTAT